MSLTTANSSIVLSFAGLYPNGVTLQKFTADDIFDTADVSNAEVVMGIDGKMSYAWKPAPIVQTFSVMADSPTALIFDQVYASEQQAKEKILVQGIVRMTGQGLVYQMMNGVITSMSVMSSAKVTAQPRKLQVTWESMNASPI